MWRSAVQNLLQKRNEEDEFAIIDLNDLYSRNLINDSVNSDGSIQRNREAVDSNEYVDVQLII